MVRDWFSPSTRRRALQTIATAGLIGITGCTNKDDGSTKASSRQSKATDQPPGTTTDPNTLTLQEYPPEEETITEPADPWEDIEPTGIPAYHDDPNWRVMGHDTGNTFSNPHADGPDSDPTVRWTYECGGDPLNSRMVYTPAIVDGTVYVPLLRDGGKGALIAIDAESGESEPVVETESYLWRPTIVDGIAYVLFGDSTVGAFDLESGQRLWRSGVARSIGSLRRVGDTIIGTKGDIFVGIDAETGDIRWRKYQDTNSLGAYYSVRADRTVYNMAGKTRRKVRTGKVRSNVPYQLNYPVLDQGQLFGKRFDRNTLVSLDWKTLEVNWEFSPGEEYVVVGGYPGVVNGILIVQIADTERRHDSLFGLDRDTGDVLWRQLDGERLTPMFIVTDQDTAYLVPLFHPPLALDPQTGEIKWRIETETDVAGAGVALADDLLVVSDGVGNIWALE
ncbi:MAG: PQQ-binding-like beta-propeller repeat protein [Halapricum sp.]